MDGGSRKALVVVSGASGRAKAVEQALAALEAGGLTLLRREVPREKLGETILAMRGEIGCVVLAGGDGTLGAGAIALRDTGLPLGVLPAGAVNDLAHALGIPDEPVAAAEVILAGHTRRITLGSVNGQPFFTAASVGLSMEQVRTLRRAARRPAGKLRFAAAAFRASLQARRFSAIIRCGGTVHRVRTVQVTVGNGRFFAGLGSGAEAEEGQEPMLGLYSLEPPTQWGLVSMVHAFAGTGDGPIAEMRRDQSRSIELVTRLSQAVYADGERVSVTPARFGLLVRAVSVYVPEERLPAVPQAAVAAEEESGV